MRKSSLFHLSKPRLFSYWSVPFPSSQFSSQFSCVHWKLSPFLFWEGSKDVRVLWWAVWCRLVVHGSSVFLLWVWQYEHKCLNCTCHTVVPELSCVPCWFSYVSVTFWTHTIVPVWVVLSYACAFLCFSVPRCVGLKKAFVLSQLVIG